MLSSSIDASYTLPIPGADTRWRTTYGWCYAERTGANCKLLRARYREPGCNESELQCDSTVETFTGRKG